MMKINKQDYLKLLDAIIKEQEIEDFEVNEEYLENLKVEKAKSQRFQYEESQGTIHATQMTRDEIDASWKNQGNIVVGNFLLKVSGFSTDKYRGITYITFNLYDYEKDERGKVTATKIDVAKDVRFAEVEWKGLGDKLRFHAPLAVTLDIIEWLQKLDRLAAFV